MDQSYHELNDSVVIPASVAGAGLRRRRKRYGRLSVGLTDELGSSKRRTHSNAN